MLVLLKFFSTNVFLHIWTLLLIIFLLNCKKKKKNIIIVIVVFTVVWFSGTRFFAESILRPLEYAYKPPPLDSLKSLGVDEIVILGGGSYPQRSDWLYSRSLTLSSTMRLTAALELASRIGPQCKLIFTGGLPGLPEAWQMAQTAKFLDSTRTVFADTLSRRTSEHPKTAARFIKNNRFILLTTAAHIPRSMRVFRDAGFDPVPFPVDFQYNRPYNFADHFPTVIGLIFVQSAIYEYIAWIVYLLGG